MPDPKMVERLLTDLNSETFAVREKATQELTKLGDLAEPALRKTLQSNPAQRQSNGLRKSSNGLPDPSRRRTAYGRCGPWRRWNILATMPKVCWRILRPGAGARLTREAKDALERLAKFELPPLPAKLPRTDLYGDPLPEGAVGRLGTIRFRRENLGITLREGMVFLPGDNAIVTFPITTTGLPLSKDHGIQIWETATGHVLRTINTEPLKSARAWCRPTARQSRWP